MRRKWEIALYVGVGLVLGLGIAGYQNGSFGRILAQVGKERSKIEAGGDFGSTGPSKSDVKVASGERKPSDKKPNIVFILADNVGWGDFSVYGGTTPTPNIDKLARGHAFQ